jgi:hypothetical protein
LVTRLLKIGLWTLLAGLLSVFGGGAQGFGPCGPSSMLALFMILGGLLAVPCGLVLTVIGLFLELKGRRSPAPSGPTALPQSD